MAQTARGCMQERTRTFSAHPDCSIAEAVKKWPRVPAVVGRWAVHKRAAQLLAQPAIIPPSVAENRNWVVRVEFPQPLQLVNHSRCVPENVHVKGILVLFLRLWCPSLRAATVSTVTLGGCVN